MILFFKIYLFIYLCIITKTEYDKQKHVPLVQHSNWNRIIWPFSPKYTRLDSCKESFEIAFNEVLPNCIVFTMPRTA